MKTTARTNKVPHKALVIFILGLIATIDPFSIDFYLPAFTDIAKSLGTTASKVSLSLSSYAFGLAIGQIMYGPIVDRYGRRIPLYCGLSVYILCCFGCMQSGTLQMLIIFRFLQALSGSVAAVTAFAMARDLFPVKESARIFSLIMLVIGISPLAAPTIGGFVADWLGWQWVFMVLAIIVVVIMVLTYLFLPPGAPPDNSISLKPKPIVLTFWSILRNTQFITYVLSGSFAFATLFIYVSASPVIFMDIYGVSPHAFGLIFSLLSCGFIGSNQLNIFMLKRFRSNQIFKGALLAHIVFAIIFLVAALNNWLGLTGVVVMFMLTLGCLGSINPNASALSLAPFQNNIGSASALMGFIQIGMASCISSLVGLLDVKNIIPIPAIMVGTSLVAIIIFWIGRSRMKQFSEPDANAVIAA